MAWNCASKTMAWACPRRRSPEKEWACASWDTAHALSAAPSAWYLARAEALSLPARCHWCPAWRIRSVNKQVFSVFLVDDHPLVREWLTNLINQLADMRACGEAACSQEAIEGVERVKPDVAIVDLSLKEGSGLDLVKGIKAQFPGTAVIVLS